MNRLRESGEATQMTSEVRIRTLVKYALLCLLCVSICDASALAHILDEYLEAAQISLAPNSIGVEVRFTAGADVAARVFRLIDLDRNGEISKGEELAYSERVRQDVALEVDGNRLPLVLRGIQIPSLSEMKEGNSAVRIDLTAKTDLAVGEHNLTFRNDHLPELGVYQANALVPATTEITIADQQRDALQHELRLRFNVNTHALSSGKAAGFSIASDSKSSRSSNSLALTLVTGALFFGAILTLLRAKGKHS